MIEEKYTHQRKTFNKAPNISEQIAEQVNDFRTSAKINKYSF